MATATPNNGGDDDNAIRDISNVAVASSAVTSPPPPPPPPFHLPRVAITFCTQCRWMLRAAYFAQELLSTFSGTTLGEVALIPATGGLFQVHLTCVPAEGAAAAATATVTETAAGSAHRGEGAEGEAEGVREILLWDRKAEGGFPEAKVLKQRVRDWIEPKRDLGHSDKHGKTKEKAATGGEGKKVEGAGVGAVAGGGGAKADGKDLEGTNGKQDECQDCR